MLRKHFDGVRKKKAYVCFLQDYYDEKQMKEEENPGYLCKKHRNKDKIRGFTQFLQSLPGAIYICFVE